MRLLIALAFHTLSHSFFLFSFMPPQPPKSTLFPYTTLFRSGIADAQEDRPMQLTRFLKGFRPPRKPIDGRSEEHTSELQSRVDLVCRLLLEKKKKQDYTSA